VSEIPINKIIVISNGVNLNEIYKEESNFVEKHKNKKIMLSVSHLINIKGIDLNLKVLARLKEKYPNLIYLIIGDGPERKNLEKLVQNLKLQDKVEFLGQLPHNEVMEYMSICDIFSLPSWNEAFGVVYIEVMANAKPVIACRGEGIDGIIKHKETGLLVKPKDINSLVEAIDYLLSNAKRRKKIGEAARKLVLENYTWEKIVRKIIRIYKEVLKK